MPQAKCVLQLFASALPFAVLRFGSSKTLLRHYDFCHNIWIAFALRSAPTLDISSTQPTMPELPEVETSRAYVEEFCLGSVIVKCLATEQGGGPVSVDTTTVLQKLDWTGLSDLET